MLQNIAITLLSLVACFLFEAVATHRPMDISRRGLQNNVHFEKRGHPNQDDLFKKYEYYNNMTAEFWVNGTGIPDVDFDVGESYAGLLPISKKKDEARKLWFWFFPTTGEAKDDVVIWLNGGPGIFPFWSLEACKHPPDVVLTLHCTRVEQPVGTGFSQGEPSATSEEDVAEQFLGFFENFIKTFGLQNKKIYVTGESYAGAYVPYIVDAMHAKKDKKYFDVRGLLIYDPVLTSGVVGQQIPVAPYVDYWAPLFGLNTTTMDELHQKADNCGYTSYIEENLVYPPKGPFPTPPQLNTSTECDVWTLVMEYTHTQCIPFIGTGIMLANESFSAVLLKNPCFNVYEITTTCPLLWDVLGFPGSFLYLPEGADIYFNKTDVQKAINAPFIEWEECSSDDVFIGGVDTSDPSSWSVLPRVIEMNERTIIGHGLLDFILFTNGTLLAIQNMTWCGEQGFQNPPVEPFMIPYNNQGIMGVTHTERKLTYVEIELSGHMVPQFQPGAGFRHLEYLLGRIPSL